MKNFVEQISIKFRRFYSTKITGPIYRSVVTAYLFKLRFAFSTFADNRSWLWTRLWRRRLQLLQNPTDKVKKYLFLAEIILTVSSICKEINPVVDE